MGRCKIKTSQSGDHPHDKNWFVSSAETPLSPSARDEVRAPSYDTLRLTVRRLVVPSLHRKFRGIETIGLD